MKRLSEKHGFLMPWALDVRCNPSETGTASGLL